MSQNRVEFGDWQTDYEFALYICSFLKEKGIDPKVIVEPTCGKGNFIKAALTIFSSVECVYALDIYKPYIDEVVEISKDYPNTKFHIFHCNIFDFNFSTIVEDDALFLGNPPWVTNSKLGDISSQNRPEKSNFKGHKGLDAMTGKGNFDIAEYILLKICKEYKPRRGMMAFLVKNSVIKSITIEQQRHGYGLTNLAQYEFDALKEFGASTSASLFMGDIAPSSSECKCDVYDLYTKEFIRTFGLIENKVVSDITRYKASSFVDGCSTLVWRSGIKHDCAKVMELSAANNRYKNGLGEHCDLESDKIFPFIKSSDIKEPIIKGVRRYVILTQRRANEETNSLIDEAPKLYSYLTKHAKLLDDRKSSIYKARPRFCLFGIGDYSFKPYKVVVSALYKKIQFSIVGQIDSKPVMLDDTCYSIGFEQIEFAEITRDLLNSDVVQSFIESISFSDAKRVINKDLLMRIDLYRVANHIGHKGLGISKTTFDQYLSILNQQQLLFA